MVFSNSIFLIRFLPAVLLLYFAAPRMLRNAILFVASLIFYAWGEPVYVVLMIFSTVVDYTHGMLVESNLKKGNRARARYFVIESMVINLALLGFFKYADFLINNFNALFGSEIPLLHLALPIGISFYTFQTMSYTVDVYRGQAKVQRDIISFGAYVALFPQLIAGPIVQYKTVAEELNARKENCDLFASGVMKFMCGFGKKVLLANNIGMLWDTVSAMAPVQTSVLAAWHTVSRCILTFPDIRIWQLVLGGCLDSIFWKISIIRLCQRVLQNFGADGISRWGAGFENMCISRWGETA